MGDEGHEAPVSREHGRRRESEPRIFHSAERKARRKHEHVVAVPPVRPIETLRRLHHLFGVRELVGGAIEERRLRVHARPMAQGRERQIAGRDGQQVGRDALRHREPIRSAASGCRVARGAHDRDQLGRRPDGRAVGQADLGRVLNRDPASGVDGLRLREEKRMLPPGGLRRREPLEPGSARPRRVTHPHAVGVRRKRDPERSAEDRIGRAQRKLHGPPAPAGDRGFGRGDVQAARVEHEGVRRAIDAFEHERGRAFENAPVETHVEVEVHVAYAYPPGFGVRVHVARRHRRHTLAKDGRRPGPRGRLA